MARIRTVKPELFRHEELFECEVETNLPIRIAFAGLFTAADREGRFEWKPKTLKLDCLPHDEVDFSRVLDALTTRGFVVRYACNGREYGVIPSFTRHQVINNRETESHLPPPPAKPEESTPPTREPRVDDACATPLVQDQGEGKGREGKGRSEGKSEHTQKFSPPDVDEVVEYLTDKQVLNPRPLAVKFFNHYESNGWMVGKNKMKKWKAAISGNNWISEHQAKQKIATTSPHIRDLNL